MVPARRIPCAALAALLVGVTPENPSASSSAGAFFTKALYAESSALICWACSSLTAEKYAYSM